MDERAKLPELTALEGNYWRTIREKDGELRRFLAETSIGKARDPAAWFAYLAGIRDILGNLSNSLGFVATLLAKDYLVARFAIADFDAALKPQGAPGIDIEVQTPDGRAIVGEIKTTKPYQPGFGANQKATILKDLERLATVAADHRIMFVSDPEAFRTLCGPKYRQRFPTVEIVNLVTRQSSGDPSA